MKICIVLTTIINIHMDNNKTYVNHASNEYINTNTHIFTIITS